MRSLATKLASHRRGASPASAGWSDPRIAPELRRAVACRRLPVRKGKPRRSPGLSAAPSPRRPLPAVSDEIDFWSSEAEAQRNETYSAMNALPILRSALDQSSLVINRSWIPVHVTTVRRAITMVYQEIASVIATDTLQVHDFESWISLPSPAVTRWIRGAGYTIPAPEVVQLRVYDRVPAHEAPFTRKNLYQRDQHTCQYCGRRGNPDRMSIDHVLPKSKGGRTSWENCVLACVRCNARKADRSLNDAGLRLQRKPARPRWSPYLSLSGNDRLQSWRRFTPDDLWELGDFAYATGS